MWRSWLSSCLGLLLFRTVPCQGYRTLVFYDEWVSEYGAFVEWSCQGGSRSTLRKTCLLAAMSTANLAVWLGIDLVLRGERLTSNRLGHGSKAWSNYLVEWRVNFWGQLFMMHCCDDTEPCWLRCILEVIAGTVCVEHHSVAMHKLQMPGCPYAWIIHCGA
jgi:hypothetical protein